MSTGGLCGSLRQPTCAVERSSASGWTRGRVPARLTWPAKPCALPWVLPWVLLWALPWALPRSAVGQPSSALLGAGLQAAGGKPGARGPWTSWPSFAAFLHVAGCNVACTMAAPLACALFMVEPSGARVSVISFVCQDSKFLSGLSSFCQDSQVCLSGLSSLRQDCPIRTIPHRAARVERGAGRLSFTAGGEGRVAVKEAGRWKSRQRHL